MHDGSIDVLLPYEPMLFSGRHLSRRWAWPQPPTGYISERFKSQGGNAMAPRDFGARLLPDWCHVWQNLAEDESLPPQCGS